MKKEPLAYVRSCKMPILEAFLFLPGHEAFTMFSICCRKAMNIPAWMDAAAVCNFGL